MRTQRIMLKGHHTQRRGVTAVLVLVCLATILTFAAITVDVGAMYNTRADLQRTADAAALAAAMALMDNDRLKGEAYQLDVFSDSRDSATTYTSANKVSSEVLSVAYGDVNIGYLSDATDGAEAQSFVDADKFNSVQVKIRRDSTINGPMDLLFARVFGKQSTSVTAQATAAYMDGIVGWRIPANGDNADLLPIAVKVTSWQNLLAGIATSGDNYAYDPETGTVSPGSDGIEELNIYPGSAAAGQLPPGNFGTVDIGPSNNSTADLSDQIVNGVSEDDLAVFGGELRFGPDGTLTLNGDTGLSAGIKDDLTAIIGQPRAIPLFTTVAGPGNNANFTIVGWAGMRILYVKLTGSMSGKKVIVQPAMLIDDSAIAEDATGTSYNVYRPVEIVR